MGRHPVRRLLVAGALVLGAAWGVFGHAWLQSEPSPPSVQPSPHEAPLGFAAGPAVATPLDAVPIDARASTVETERVQPPSARASVHGCVRLFDGQPLAGFGVQLRRLDRERASPSIGVDVVPPLPVLAPTATAADGSFGFNDLDAGRYRVMVTEMLGTLEEEIVLVAGERREVTFTVRGVLVRASVHNGEPGLPWARYAVRRDGEEELVGRADKDGVFWVSLPPGTCEVRVFSDVWPVAPLAVQTMAVPAGVARTAWRLDVHGTDLEVMVHDGDGNAAGAFTARLDGVLGANGERAVREFFGSAGRAVFALIPEGEWQVTVVASDFVTPPPQTLKTRAAIPREQLDYVVMPAAVVPLELLRADGSPFRVDPELLPWICVGDRHVPCTAVGKVEGQSLPKQILFGGVPVGRASLELADRTGADGVEFLPFEPVPTLTIDVARGVMPPVRVTVSPRAEVDVRGCEAGGREDIESTVRIFAGEREVRGRPRLPAQRWLGWLPPGDYRVVVTRPSGPCEHTLRVDRADVHLRLRP